MPTSCYTVIQPRQVVCNHYLKNYLRLFKASDAALFIFGLSDKLAILDNDKLIIYFFPGKDPSDPSIFPTNTVITSQRFYIQIVFVTSVFIITHSHKYDVCFIIVCGKRQYCGSLRLCFGLKWDELALLRSKVADSWSRPSLILLKAYYSTLK